MMYKTLLIFLITFLSTSIAKAEGSDLYVDRLKQWLSNPQESTIQKEVLENCSKLTMLTATTFEKVKFATHIDIDEYDFRSSFCMKAVINNVWSQPEFEQGMHFDVCRENIKLVKIVCREFVR